MPFIVLTTDYKILRQRTVNQQPLLPFLLLKIHYHYFAVKDDIDVVGLCFIG